MVILQAAIAPYLMCYCVSVCLVADAGPNWHNTLTKPSLRGVELSGAALSGRQVGADLQVGAE